MRACRDLTFVLALWAAPVGAADGDTALWRLGCGAPGAVDGAVFAQDGAFAGSTVTLTNSCYLIRHRGQYVVWDAGLPEAALPEDAPTLAGQLAALGLAPGDVSTVVLSHHHLDHTGQLGAFDQAELVIGAADWGEVWAVDAGTADNGYVAPSFFAPWLEADGRVRPILGDLDLFGDGVVTIKAAPGHTAGSQFLLLDLPQTGYVILSGDVAHFERQFDARKVAVGTHDGDAAQAAMDHVAQLAASLPALLVIGHDPLHIGLLPPFPEAAR